MKGATVYQNAVCERAAHANWPPRFAGVRSTLALLAYWAWHDGYSRQHGEPCVIPAPIEPDEFMLLGAEHGQALATWCQSTRRAVADVSADGSEASRGTWQAILAALPAEVPEHYAAWFRACMTPSAQA